MRLRIQCCSAVAGIISLLPFVTQVYAQPAKLLPADGEASDFFGLSVALSADGRYAVIGATGDDDGGSESGAAYVFHFDGSGWTEQAKLTSPMGSAEDYFGASVAVSGDGSVVLVGSSVEDTTGAVHVYERTGTSWTHGSRIVPAGAVNHDRFGVAVAVAADGSRAIIGAPGVDGADTWSGAAYVFARDGDVWSQMSKMTPSDGADGDEFGCAAALSAETVLTGSLFADTHGENSGAAYAFAERNCPPDTNCDGVVSAVDLGLMLGGWGPVDHAVPIDIDGDGAVTAFDLGLLLGGWGICP